MKKILMCSLSLSLLLSGCNGGGSSSNSSPTPPPTNNLIPLTISLHDLSNNPMEYIDLSKLGSHTEYKLTFTNPNSVAITGLISSNEGPTIDEFWEDYQASPNKESLPTSAELQNYYYKFNPGVGSVTDYFYKTTNTDDCFNKLVLQPGDSCSLYTLALSEGNYSESDFFSYPLTYMIVDNGNSENKLNVQQYNYDQWSGFKKQDMPGLDKQFIAYKMIHTNSSISASIVADGNIFSFDGRMSYQCDSVQGINCAKYALSYNALNNTLSVADNPSYTFTLPSEFRNNRDMVVSNNNGSRVWYIANVNGEYEVANSNDPTKHYYVPNIQYSTFDGGIGGVDSSFWFNPYNTSENFNADVYVESSDSFVATNIPRVYGIESNGVVLGATNYHFYCYRNPTESHQYQTQQLLQNYTDPINVSHQVYSTANGLYLEMNIPGILNSNGESVLNTYGLYKLHTENNKCELQLDDYVSALPFSLPGYAIVEGVPTSMVTSGAVVVPLSEVYIGK